jgi:putative lipoic acid-binding regulatory protein
MKDLDDIHAQNPDQGFQFPGLFEITAMGKAAGELERRVPEILAGIGLGVMAGSERVRPSKGGNYVAVTVSFTCPTRAKYDEAHAVLRADPEVYSTL